MSENIQPRAPLPGLPHAEGFSSKGPYRPFHPLLVACMVQTSSGKDPGHCCCRGRTAMCLCVVTYFGILDEELDGFLRSYGWRSLSLPLLTPSSQAKRPEPVPARPCCSALPPLLPSWTQRHTAVLLFAEAVEGRPTMSPPKWQVSSSCLSSGRMGRDPSRSLCTKSD